MTLSQELQHTLEVRAGVADVWSLLWDIRALAGCLLGCENVVAVVEGRSYQAEVRRKVAMFSIRFVLSIEVIDTQPGRSIDLVISGRDKRLKSEIQQKLVVQLQAIDPDLSRIDIATTINISGLLASLGKHLVAMQFAQVVEDFAANMSAAIEQRASQGAVNESR